MDKSRDNKVSIAFIVVSVIINFVNYTLFYNVINPFYEFASFVAFCAGTLGITIFPLGVAAVIAAFFMIPKGHKHRYPYYFGITFLILSLISIVMSATNAVYMRQFLP
jgi:hypothetical protein